MICLSTVICLSLSLSLHLSVCQVPVLLDFGLVKRLSSGVRLGLARLVVGAHALGAILAAPGRSAPPAGAALAKDVIMEAFRELGLPLGAGGDTELLVEVALFLFRPSTSIEAAEAARAAVEAKQRSKVLGTLSDQELKKVAPSAEEARAKRVAMTPLSALPEELILFQRVLTLLRGLATSHSVALNFMELLEPFASEALRREGRYPAALRASPSSVVAQQPEPASAPPAAAQCIEGTHWAMQFDDEGEIEYRDVRTGTVVWDAPLEVLDAQRKRDG
jgi:hypothetical protein